MREGWELITPGETSGQGTSPPQPPARKRKLRCDCVCVCTVHALFAWASRGRVESVIAQNRDKNGPRIALSPELSAIGPRMAACCPLCPLMSVLSAKSVL